MQKKANSFLAFMVFLSGATLFAQQKDISKLIEERVKIVDAQQSINTHGVTYRHGKAPQVNNREFTSTNIDSSKNGYGAYYKVTNPLAYGVDEGYFACYRQWITEESTHGIIGAAQSEDGEEWFTSQELNMIYPNGNESPNLPTATGTPQGRYPSAGYVEGSKPTAIWNEYTNASFGGGQYGGYPLHTYNTLGMGEDAYWVDPISSNTGCATTPCDPPDLWNGNAMLIPEGNSYKFLAAYSTWATGDYDGGTWMITSSYHTNGYNLLNDPYLLTHDAEITEDGDSLWYGINYISTPDFHINEDGVGYLVQVGWSNLTDTDGNDQDVDLITDQNQGIFFKMTDDYGDSWTDEGGFKNSGYHVIPDAVALRLTDSLYTVWAEEENEYYHHYGDTLWFEGDTLEDGTYIDWLMTPGWFPFYTFEMRTDSEGGLHIAFPTIRRLCKDSEGGCDDLDDDGYADSLYYTWTLGGSGIWHIYSPDPMSGEDNWTASLIFDMSADYEAAWSGSNVATLFHDGSDDYFSTMQYFYPNITMSAESEDVMWFAVSGMSDYIYSDLDSTDIIPTNVDVFMAKSTDNGLHWSEAENVTNTPGYVEGGETNDGGYPIGGYLEAGVHIANKGMDETVGVFYQVPDFNALTIVDDEGYEDYKNWVYVGIYENDWEYEDTTTVGLNEDILPKGFTLSQNYPNPFNPITHIQYDMNAAGMVSMDLFDIRGAKVKTLINEHKPAGSYEFTFDGSHLSSGVYFYTMTANGITKTRKLVLMK